MDARRLVILLVRFWNEERRVWSTVRVPSVEEEDRRHLHRDLLTVKRDRTRLANWIQGLLANQRVRVDWRRPLPAQLEDLRLWDGSSLPERLRARLDQEWERLELLNRKRLASPVFGSPLPRATMLREEEIARWRASDPAR